MSDLQLDGPGPGVLRRVHQRQPRARHRPAGRAVRRDAPGRRPHWGTTVLRQAFLHALPRRVELFAASITRVVLADLQHQTLDDAYVLARTTWRAERAGASKPVRLSSTFILRQDADRLQVVFCLNHQDLAQALSAA
jgi:hypothetical protein